MPNKTDDKKTTNNELDAFSAVPSSVVNIGLFGTDRSKIPQKELDKAFKAVPSDVTVLELGSELDKRTQEELSALLKNTVFSTTTPKSDQEEAPSAASAPGKTS